MSQVGCSAEPSRILRLDTDIVRMIQAPLQILALRTIHPLTCFSPRSAFAVTSMSCERSGAIMTTRKRGPLHGARCGRSGRPSELIEMTPHHQLGSEPPFSLWQWECGMGAVLQLDIPWAMCARVEEGAVSGRPLGSHPAACRYVPWLLDSAAESGGKVCLRRPVSRCSLG